MNKEIDGLVEKIRNDMQEMVTKTNEELVEMTFSGLEEASKIETEAKQRNFDDVLRNLTLIFVSSLIREQQEAVNQTLQFLDSEEDNGGENNQQ